MSRLLFLPFSAEVKFLMFRYIVFEVAIMVFNVLLVCFALISSMIFIL